MTMLSWLKSLMGRHNHSRGRIIEDEAVNLAIIDSVGRVSALTPRAMRVGDTCSISINIDSVDPFAEAA